MKNQNRLVPYNSETDDCIDYIESLKEKDLDELIEELFSTDSIDERMDIVEQLLDILGHILCQEFNSDITNLDWWSSLEDDIKDLVIE